MYLFFYLKYIFIQTFDFPDQDVIDDHWSCQREINSNQGYTDSLGDSARRVKCTILLDTSYNTPYRLFPRVRSIRNKRDIIWWPGPVCCRLAPCPRNKTIRECPAQPGSLKMYVGSINPNIHTIFITFARWCDHFINVPTELMFRLCYKLCWYRFYRRTIVAGPGRVWVCVVSPAPS